VREALLVSGSRVEADPLWLFEGEVFELKVFNRVGLHTVS
jgi:hypothetical protein